MKLHLDRAPGLFLVTAIRDADAEAPAAVAINGVEYGGALLVQTSEPPVAWSIVSFAALTEADFEPLLALQPDVVLVGTGVRQRFAHPRLYAGLTAAQIGVDFMDTAAACRTYNILAGEQRRVVAALIIE